MFALLLAFSSSLAAADLSAPSVPAHQDRVILGWTVRVNTALLDQEGTAVEKAMALLQTQLDEIVRKVPAPAVRELQKVPLWFNPEYPGTQPRAEFHPGADWLRQNGRDPAMAQAVEFTNVSQFEAETRRMPNFTLHELAHAYHFLTVRMGFANLELRAAYEKARASGKYDHVPRRDSEGRTTLDRAYAMTNPQEYFAEGTEACFSRNDFYPFTRDELKEHDPDLLSLLERLWGVTAPP
jgi:hypothetical protein